MDNYSLYKSLSNGYSKAHPTKTKKQCQDDVNKMWNEIKQEKNVSELVSQKVLQYKEKELTAKSTLLSYWNKAATTSCSKNDLPTSSSNVEANISDSTEINLSNSFEEFDLNASDATNEVQVNNDGPSSSTVVKEQVIQTPGQYKLQQEINCLTADITALTQRKESGLFSEDMRNDLKQKRASLSKAEVKLRKTQRDMIRKRKSRSEFKNKLTQILEKNPDMQKELKVNSYFV